MSNFPFIKPVKLGILGAGSFVQRRILPLLKEIPSIQVTCLYKQNLDEAKQVAAMFGIPYAVSSREELVHHQEVEAVLIATPNSCHEEDALLCARAGKSVLCEKPLAPTSQAIIRMQQAFKEQDVTLCVGQSLRFKPALVKAKELLKEGLLGDLLHIRAYFTLPVSKDNWRFKKSFGGGALQDIGVHLIDLIQYIAADTIACVGGASNLAYREDSTESEHTVEACGRLQNGAGFSFLCSLDQPLRSGFEVIGTKARLISSESLRQSHDAKETLCYTEADGSSEYIALPTNNIYAEELGHFAQVVRGEEPSLITSAVGLCNQYVIEAIYESLHTGKIVIDFL